MRNDFIARVIGRREYNKLTDSDTKATTSNKLSDNVSFDTDGTITLENSSGNAVLKMNQAVSGVSSAGFGTIQGGPLEQYGFLIDENPLSGTYQKSLAYARSKRRVKVSAYAPGS